MPTKSPQDHLQKKTTATEPRTTEVDGLTLTIDEAALDDFELLADLKKLDSGTPDAALSMPRVLEAFLGAEQYRTVMDHLRDPETGRVSIEAGARFIGDLMRGLTT